MTYPELLIHLDLLDKYDRFDFIKSNLPCFLKSKKIFAVCDDGDCHLFDEDGDECDISEVKEIYEFENYQKLIKIDIPNDITNIGDYAFDGCSGLTSVTIGNSVTSIEDYAFWNCSGLTSVTIPDGVASIGPEAFSNCGCLTSVTIGNSVTSIEGGAFSFCSSLTRVTINSKIKIIGYNAFYDCSNLRELIFKSKTIDQIKAMENYPWRIKDESIIKCN